jgi:hypothetical protein
VGLLLTMAGTEVGPSSSLSVLWGSCLLWQVLKLDHPALYQPCGAPAYYGRYRSWTILLSISLVGAPANYGRYRSWTILLSISLVGLLLTMAGTEDAPSSSLSVLWGLLLTMAGTEVGPSCSLSVLWGSCLLWQVQKFDLLA